MPKKNTVPQLLSRREHLVDQLKRLDESIKIARRQERDAKAKKLIHALAERGLLDADPEALLAKLDPRKPASIVPDPQPDLRAV